MKKTMFILISVMLLFSCQTEPFSLETAGYDISQDINTVQMRESIRRSLIKYHWVILKDTEEYFTAEFTKNGGIMARIQVDYDQTTYSIKYLDSSNLSVNMDRMVIHYNFNRWIANLNKDIYMKYYNNL